MIGRCPSERAAAEAIAGYENRFTKIDQDMAVFCRESRGEDSETLTRCGPVQPHVKADKSQARRIIFHRDERGCELQTVRGSERMHAQQPLRHGLDPSAGLYFVPHLRQRIEATEVCRCLVCF